MKSAATTRQAIDFASVGRKLQSPRADGGDPIEDVVDIVAQCTGALGVAVVGRDAANRLRIDPRHLAPRRLTQLKSLLQHMLRLATVASSEQAPQAAKVEGGDELMVISAPLRSTALGAGAVCLAVGVPSPEQARQTSVYFTQLLIWVAAYISRLDGGGASTDSDALGNSAATLQRMTVAMQSAAAKKSLAEQGRVCAEWLRDETQSPIVAIGMRGTWRAGCALIGFSGIGEFDDRARSVRLIEEIMDEALIADQPGRDPRLEQALDATDAPTRLLQENGLRIGRRHVFHDPLDEPLGVILFLHDERRDQHASSGRSDALSPEVPQLAGGMLGLLRDARIGPLRRLRQSARRWYRRPATWVAACGLSLLMLLPLPLKVACPCQVEPRDRRFVAVPYEGRLEEALAEPGEVVHEGQLLARMDGREIQWELSGLTADLRRAEKERDTALAAFDTAAAQMAGLEVERLRLRINLLKDRLDELEVRSPVDGIVIGGDPRKIEGARMSMGQTILEVGPLKDMIVELEIADRDIAHVKTGQQVRFRLAALPGEKLRGRLQRVHPRAEIRDERNVFIGELAVANPQGTIRPGMRGRAKIVTDRHPLGWNLFHKGWESLRLWFW